MLDIKKVQDEAEKEIAEEFSGKAKTALKTLLRQIRDAELVVGNLKREKEDLLIRISEGDLL